MTKQLTRGRLLAPSAAVLAICLAGRFFNEGESALHAEKIAANKEQQAELLTKCEELQNAADAEKRELTAEERETMTALMADFDTLEADTERRTNLMTRTATLMKGPGRKTTATGDDDSKLEPVVRPNGAGARDLGPLAERSKTYGFKSMGDFARAVCNHARSNGTHTDERLKAAAATTISTEGVGQDGGFAVPPEYREAILTRAFDQESLIGMTDPIPLSGNQITFPADMTTPWDTTGGIQAYWEGEANPFTQSKVKLENLTVKLAKLTALVPVTEELLEDNAALGGYINRKAPEKIDFKLSYALVWGNGVGMPLGFMNSPALVTVAAEGGQTADTIVAMNVLKMYSRMPGNQRRNGRWLIHADAEPQIPVMAITNTQVSYLPPGGLQGNPYGTLLGRPMVQHEVCETLGDLGDIMFVDMTAYLAARKSSGLRAQTSIHLWFDQDLVAFKFVLRVGGQPWWSAPITPRDGSNTRSPFVALAAR